jgi:hypothetical protein
LPVLSLAVSGAADRTWYAGTPAGLFRSRDNATSWQRSSQFQTVAHVATGPPGATVVAATGESNATGLVATDGSDATGLGDAVVVASADGNVVRSADGGSTWTVVPVPFEAADVSGFALPTPRGVLAATWSASRRTRDLWFSPDQDAPWEHICTSPGDAPLVLARWPPSHHSRSPWC